MGVGALVTGYRERRGLSQERCAEACDLDRALISRLERGKRAATRASVAALCAGLGLAGRDADALWLAAGYVPPDLDPAQLLDVVTWLRRERAAAARLAG